MQHEERGELQGAPQEEHPRAQESWHETDEMQDVEVLQEKCMTRKRSSGRRRRHMKLRKRPWDHESLESYRDSWWHRTCIRRCWKSRKRSSPRHWMQQGAGAERTVPLNGLFAKRRQA
jgi:hypothetical protein